MKKIFNKNNIIMIVYIITSIMITFFISHFNITPDFSWLGNTLPESNFILAKELNEKKGMSEEESLREFLPNEIDDSTLSYFIEDRVLDLFSDENIWYRIQDKDSKIEITNNSEIYRFDENNFNKNLFMYYIIFDYDKDGHLKVSSNYDFSWQKMIDDYNNEYISSYLTDIDLNDKDTYNNLKLNNPKNVTITYTIKSKNLMNINSTSYQYIYSFSQLQNYSFKLLSSAFLFVIVIALLVKNEDMWLLTYLEKNFIELNFIAGFALIFGFCLSLLKVLLECLYGGHHYFIFFIIIIFLMLYLAHLLVTYCQYIIKNSIPLKDISLCYKAKQLLHKEYIFQKNQPDSIREYSLVIASLLTCIILIISLLFIVLLDISFIIPIVIIVFIFIYTIIHNFLATYFQQYHLLVDATKRLSEGHFDTDIEEELTYFKDFQEYFSHVKEGFETAVTEEIKSERMKSELISNVSHDLKTPLTSIITYIDLLKKNKDNKEDVDNYIAVLDRNSLRLKRLIEDLFDVTKANTGNIQVNYELIDIVALIKQAQFECLDLFQMNDLIIKNNFTMDKYMIMLDSSKTYRIFENLFSNVSQYALSHTRVYVDVDEDDNNIVIMIKNISALEMNFTGDEIVERFVRGDKARNTSGSGLGLAIAKSFTELQNGQFKIVIDGDLFKAIIKFKKKKD